MQLSKEGEHAVIVFNERLTISDIQSQRVIYQKALASAKTIELQADILVSIDTASIQLLLIFFIAAKQKNITYKWQSCSSALLKVARLAGLVQLFELSEQNNVAI